MLCLLELCSSRIYLCNLDFLQYLKSKIAIKWQICFSLAIDNSYLHLLLYDESIMYYFFSVDFLFICSWWTKIHNVQFHSMFHPFNVRSHTLGGILYFLTIAVPNLVRVAVVAPIVNSDHSYLSAVISMAQAVPNLCVSRIVFLKHQVNWNTVCSAIQDLPWRNIWSADNTVEVLN